MVDGRLCVDVVQLFEQRCKPCTQIDREAFDRPEVDSAQADRKTIDVDTREIGDRERKPGIDSAQGACEALDRETRDWWRCEGIDQHCSEAAQHREAQDHDASPHELAGTPRRRHDRRYTRRRKRLSGAILELKTGQARVESSARAEARMRSFLDDLAVVHDDDSVGGADRR